jgi:NDP-sugar pyrophosphorylase family protein
VKAIVFAAGLGTRLKPLTDSCPKALIELNGKPMIWYTINNLKKYGVNELVVNVHHHASMLINYLHQTNFGIPIHISDESDLLLDTGGGLLKARPFLDGDESFIAINVDIISSVDLKKVFNFHLSNKPFATVVVRKRQTGRLLLFNENQKLIGWRNSDTGEVKISDYNYFHFQQLAFSGIHIISPAIFDLISEKGKFSIIELYLRLAMDKIILGYEDSSDFWIDLGKPGQIAISEEYLGKGGK